MIKPEKISNAYKGECANKTPETEELYTKSEAHVWVRQYVFAISTVNKMKY